jgi:hypothetical protein
MLIFECPFCGLFLEIEQINCGIFRHGAYIDNNHQIDCHMPKDKCDNLFNNGKIYGCGKPFRITNINNVYKIEKLFDYI